MPAASARPAVPGGCGELPELRRRSHQGLIERRGLTRDAAVAILDLDRALLGRHQRPDDQPRAGGDSGVRLARVGLPVAEDPAEPLRLLVPGGSELGLTRFLVAQAGHEHAQRGQRRRCIRTARRQAQVRAPAGTERQQRGDIARIGDRITATDVDLRLVAVGQLSPLCSGPGMQTVRIVQRERMAELEILQRRRTLAGRGVAGQGADDVVRIARARQLFDAAGVAHQPRQAAQHIDVLVGCGGDRHHQPRLVGIVAPAHAGGHLEHRQTGASDQALVLDHAMRDRHPLTEESAADAFALHQAVHIGRLDEAGLHQHRASRANRVFAVVRGGPETHFDGKAHANSSSFVIDNRY